MNKKILFSALIAVVVIATSVIVYVKHEPKSTVQVTQTVGAVSTLDGVNVPNVNVAGRRSAQISVPLTATSSVLCALGPSDLALGTSTAKFSFYVASSTIAKSEFFGLSTSTTAYSSSTNNWMKGTIPAFGSGFNARLMWNSATSTGVLGTNDNNLWYGMDSATGTATYVVNPGQKLNLKIGTTTAGTFVKFPEGRCNYEFEEI